MNENRTGQAVVMRGYGPPAVLRLESVPLPALAPDEIRIRSLASAINHSDLEIRSATIHAESEHPVRPESSLRS